MRYLVALTLIAALAVPASAIDYDYRLPDDGSYTDTDLITSQRDDNEMPSTIGMTTVPFKFSIRRTREEATTENYTVVHAWIDDTQFDEYVDARDKDPEENCTIEDSTSVDQGAFPNVAQSHLSASRFGSGSLSYFENIFFEYSLEE